MPNRAVQSGLLARVREVVVMYRNGPGSDLSKALAF